jgi:hypothetical protein
MKAARATVAAISQGLDFGFQCSLIPASADTLLLRWRKTLSNLQIQDVSEHHLDSFYIQYVFEGVLSLKNDVDVSEALRWLIQT